MAAAMAGTSGNGSAPAATFGWRSGLREAFALATPFWRSGESRRSLLLLVTVIALTLGTVALNVRFSSWNSDFYDALQAHDLAVFWHQLGVFGLLATAFIIAAVYRQYLQQRLQMHWRAWMTERLQMRWLQPGSAYRLGQATASGPEPLANSGNAATPDNPDQRIAEDVRLFVVACLDLTLGLLNASVTLVSFVAILWHLSGTISMPIGAHTLPIPGYMVWVALAYAGLGSVFAHRLGRPLLSLSAQQQKAEADFRYALVQVRDHAEAVALAQGEPGEARRLQARFDAVKSNWWRLIATSKRLTWFSAGYGQLANVFPLLAASPRYFAGQMALGGLMQTAQAFGQVQGALSWFIDSYPTLADWRATVYRLSAFETAIARDRVTLAQSGVARSPSSSGCFEIVALQLRSPTGADLLAVRHATLLPGLNVLITGPSGSGKSSLLRVLAGLWPQGDGTLRIPQPARWMVVPQRPYLPDGTLAEALCYPHGRDRFGGPPLEAALRRCGLDALVDRLDRVDVWSRRLSPGEQQRLQFARVLLQAPDWVFLDEATSALDDLAEERLYQVLAEALPNTTRISIGHRAGLRRHHEREWFVTHDVQGEVVIDERMIRAARHQPRALQP